MMTWTTIAVLMIVGLILAIASAWLRCKAENKCMAENLQPAIDHQGAVPWGNDEVVR